MISLIRYPGSKAKLTKQIMRAFPPSVKLALWSSLSQTEYREPFFGAGAVGFDVLKILHPECRVWLNDADYGMASLWRTVLNAPEELIQRCNRFVPSASYFFKFKEADGDRSIDEPMSAFRKLALHRMSFSGMGAMAGGPIGGKDQDNKKYDVSCRWNPEHIKKSAMAAHRLLKKFPHIKITCGDFAPVVESADGSCFVYLDPPYYEKGPELYVHSMVDACHQRLASMLLKSPARWLLSYDDHPRIRELYAGCTFTDLHVTYTSAIALSDSRPKNREIVIYRHAA